MSDISAYPADLIARDVAGQQLAELLRRARSATFDASIRTTLIRRCTEVNRADLANSLYGKGDSHPAAALVDELHRAFPALIDELIAYCEHGPRPTPDAYAAACRALDMHRKRADEAEATLGQVREILGGADAGEVVWSLQQLLVPAEEKR